jgi:translation initiation factor IF-2
MARKQKTREVQTEATATVEAAPAEAEPRVIELPPHITVRELAEVMDVSPIELIKRLMNNGIIANINQSIDFDTAALVAEDMGLRVREQQPEMPEVEEVKEEEEAEALIRRPIFDTESTPDQLKPRPPVVTVMGHVDHGKTSLLDAIRRTNVVADEVGGITQHIGAYQVEQQGRLITFIDTPGHEAFTAMRARGAQVTDIAVLVVAADDGVMPQTVEAIDHARAAGVPIVVALNKIDKENANPERVKKQLADVGIVVDDWGGDVFCVPVSAKRRIGLDELLDAILLVADAEDLQANPDRPAAGTVIEAVLDARRGPTATVLVQTGTLKVGDIIVVGEQYGRVRAMFDHTGKRVKEAGPSTPVAVLGLPEVPEAGTIFEVVPNERTARQIVTERQEAKREVVERPAHVLTLEEIFEQMQAGQVKALNLILKADAHGSLEAIADSLLKLSTEDLKLRILRRATGDITESDITLAIASGAIVIGFQVQIHPTARALAAEHGVDVRVYQVIYELIDDVEKALQGMLEPKYEEVVLGRAEVKAVFPLRKGKVAGLLVTEGKVLRNARARVWRNGQEVFDGPIASLKRYTEDVREVAAGFECGLGLEGFDDFAEGDIIEVYRTEKVSA